MFDWREFFVALFFFLVLIVIVCLMASGLYIMCETGNAWGFALFIGSLVLGFSIAAGFGMM